MSGERRDRWAALDDAEAVAQAAHRLRQLGALPSEQAARARFLDLLAPRPGERVLDVGAGIGQLTLEIARRVSPGGEVTALDPSRGLLAIAREQADASGLGDRISVEVGDARALPQADGTFDIALCHWVLLHVDPPEAVVEEMVRVLRPGGRILCVEVDWETLTLHPGDREVTRGIVQANVDRQVDGQMGRKLVPLFRRAGLTRVQVEPLVAIDTEGAWLGLVESRVSNAVDAGRVSATDAARWWAALQEAVPEGDYFLSLTQFAVLGAKP